MADYADILNASWGEIPEEKNLPVGSWKLRGMAAKYKPPKDEDENGQVLFVYSAKEPMDDVDDAELQELGEYDYTEKRIYHKIFIGNKSDWSKVRKHLNTHGIETPNEKSLSNAMDEFKGSEVISFLEQRSFKDNSGETQTVNQPSAFTSVNEG